MSIFKKEIYLAVTCVFYSKYLFALDADDFDFNGNGKIDPGKESNIFLKHVNDKNFSKIDTNKDGEISNDEIDIYEKKLEEKITIDLIDFEDRNGLSVKQANMFYLPDVLRKKEEKSKPEWVKNIYLRRSHEDVGVLARPKDAKKVKGAIFAYTRDHEKSNDIWQAKGALMYNKRIPTEFIPTQDKGGITAYSILPSITFDRASNDNDEKKEVNSLVFRIGPQIEYMGGTSLFNSQYYQLNLAYATDFDFDSKVWAIEGQWEPVNTDWAMGVSKYVFNKALDIRWRGIIHMEMGRTTDVGDKEYLVEDDNFFRLGPALKFEVWPSFSDRLGLALSWSYLNGISGEPSHSRLFESELTYGLTEAGNVALSLSRRKGDVPLTKEKVDHFNIGFTVKY